MLLTIIVIGALVTLFLLLLLLKYLSRKFWASQAGEELWEHIQKVNDGNSVLDE